MFPWGVVVVQHAYQNSQSQGFVLGYFMSIRQGGKLVLWGGWANRWFSDGYILDVGSIVGPPYAIMDVKPDNGPITGETLLDIYGIDFINTEDILVSL